MTKRFHTYLFALLLAFSWNNDAFAQFVSVELEIRPELKSFILNQLEFPEVVTNSGRFAIELGDPSMGIFGITTYSRQSINIEVRKPEFLTSQFNETQDRIPIEINSFLSFIDWCHT